MKQAIINYINARAERLRPCKHEWELLDKQRWNATINPRNWWYEWTYRCKKCGKRNS
ncbi:unnamed protein product, partial [marine sediment metagenome]